MTVLPSVCRPVGERMKLTGLSSYGAATHCAAITAAQRDSARAAHRERASRRAAATLLQAAASGLISSVPTSTPAESEPALPECLEQPEAGGR